MMLTRVALLRAAKHLIGRPTFVPPSSLQTTKWGCRELNVSVGKQRPLSTITTAAPHPSSPILQVEWHDGGQDIYPYLWLRDNCQCPSCFHPTSHSRILPLHHIHLNSTPVTIQVSESGSEVKVEWSDGHLGTYSASWLQERSFNSNQQNASLQQYNLLQRHWGHELAEDLPCTSFPRLLQDNSALLAFLQSLEELGLVVVRDVPQQVGEIARLTERVGHLKYTHYGYTFSVTNKKDPNNLAYTSNTLDLHGDLPFLEYKPGVQLLHCITQFTGQGGDNLLCDAFHAADLLRLSQPNHFKTLTNTLVDFVDIGSENGKKFHAMTRIPMIELDYDGRIKTLNFNQMVRDSKFHVTPEAATAWYEAVMAFRDLIYHPDNHIQYKLNQGEMIVFDNLRVLHGRLGYTASSGSRQLEGGYWDWDQVKSRRRVLHSELNQ